MATPSQSTSSAVAVPIAPVENTTAPSPAPTSSQSAALSKSQHLAHPPPSSAVRTPNAASHDERTVRRVSRKLQKKRHDDEHTPTMELPESLKQQGDHADSDEEVLRPEGYGGGMFMNMNQSIFGLIAAAGSQADFGDRFEGQSSDEDDNDVERENPMAMTIAGHKALHHKPSKSLSSHLAQSTVLRKHGATSNKAESKHRRKISESRLLRSVPGLSKLTSRAKSSLKPPKPQDAETEKPGEMDDKVEEASASQPASEVTPTIEITRTESRQTAPVMSRMLEARAQMAARPSFDLERPSGEQAHRPEAGETGPTELAKRLQEIFQFDTPEEVINEFPCWLLQNVLLQGYMYITAGHVAFYAYLPKKANEVTKSGYLAKCGKHNPKYNRYFFRLKGDVLSYYRDTQNLYFPSGQVDLRYGISAEITDKDKEGVNFTIVTHKRTYYFKADSSSSAKEWVKSLRKVIFKSHNDGDSVKISLPIANILDVEETQMLGFAETCKIRVIDNDETYAIDEYFFSFFSFSEEAIDVLKTLVEGSSSQTPGQNELDEPASEAQSKRTSTSGSREQVLKSLNTRGGKITQSIKTTLSPISPGQRSPSPRPCLDGPRTSFDGFRPFSRRSVDVSRDDIRGKSPRRSFSERRTSFHRRHLSESGTDQDMERQEGSDSYVQSMEDPSQASMSGLIVSGSSEAPSASQILRGSEVFHNPAIHRSASAPRARNEAAVPEAPGTVKASRPPSISAQNGETEGNQAMPTLQNTATVGTFPFKGAGALMGYLDRQSRRMSNLLATESMGYVEKVSGMWKGGKKHYDEPAGLRTDEEDAEDNPDERATHEARFREHFALPKTEKLQAAYYAHMMRVLPLYGKIYIGNRHFCFRSLLPGTRTKLVLPLKDIENVDKEKGFRFGYAGLVVVIRGHEELFFEFNRAEIRDDCTITVLQNLEATRYVRDSGLLDSEDAEDAQAAVAERDALREARNEEFPHHEVKLPHDAHCVSEAPTILFDDPKASILNFKPSKSMKITCLTIGSRGDVQPYIALCKRLMKDGHRPRICTHAEFRDWIESHGIEFCPVGGDPSELMRLCIQNGTFTWAFLKEANSTMRGWLDDLLVTAWEACKGSDLLIESPSAMAGIHIAEALGIPYFRAFTMPWTRTRAYPHAFIMPGQKLGGAYNYVTYTLFDNVFWQTTASQINRWRNVWLGLPNTTLDKLQINKVPFLYNFSPFVVPPPIDFSDWIRVTGYWFLDEGNENKWQPSKELLDFIDKARADGKKLVYVGFGSIIVPDPAKMTQEVIDAVQKADVRCILSKGWSDRLPGSGDEKVPGPEEAKVEPQLPEEIFQIQSAPHDWLFKQIDAAAHHGGSGTTGASLRAGIPTIIRPFFGDQFFFGSRVEDLGVGICLKKWGANSFARALWEATHSERMIVKARVLGEQIRKENGVDTAVQCIYRDMEYATNLIRSKMGKNHARTGENVSMMEANLNNEDEEESWTFVGDSDTVEDLSSEALMKTVADLRDLQAYHGDNADKTQGNTVVGGAVGAGVETVKGKGVS
ncbi:Sterol 3-beta-glucosyltransferase [Podospora pseudopauciseta]|uniref:sterol 3beta-glucosyltransferase n=1 Tax=Podospora pseudopauciseta TaxID=2093780 RepID=A0ABR0HA19_9PEZI|nr:Sterol 3-beta-glucosyltransferase [Podospora pseudopauciseta]